MQEALGKRLQYIRASDLGYGDGRDIPGIDIGANSRTGWTGNAVRLLNNRSLGFDGYRLDLTGAGKVVSNYKGVPLFVERGAGLVDVIGADVVQSGGHKGIGVGRSETASLDGDYFSFRDGTITGDRGTFGVHGRGVPGRFEGVTFALGEIGQHDIYWQDDLALIDCDFASGSSTGELCKWIGAGRPWEQPRYKGPSKLLVRAVKMRGAGSGLVIQGSGGDIDLEDLTIKDLVGRAPHGIAIDNGQSTSDRATQERYWDEDGMPNGPGASNLRLRMRRVAVETAGKALGLYNNKTHAQYRGQWPWIDEGKVPVLTELDMALCGFYGGGYVDVRRDLVKGPYRVRQVNTEAIARYVERNLGIDVSQPCDLRGLLS